jgi:hypothetical protein
MHTEADVSTAGRGTVATNPADWLADVVLGLVHGGGTPSVAVAHLLAAADASAHLLAAARDRLVAATLDGPTRIRADRLLDAAAQVTTTCPGIRDAGLGSSETLQPTNRAIRAVRRPHLELDELILRRWPCSRCGCQHLLTETWAVLRASPSQCVPHAFMVCLGCAIILRPFPLTLDPMRLDGNDLHRGTAQEAAALVRRTDRLRATAADIVTVRTADVSELARRLMTTRSHVSDQLAELGALVAS